MIRQILSIIAGIIIGGIIIYLVELLGHAVYPPPEEVDMNDMKALKTYIAELPTGAFLFVLLAYATDSFFGELVTGILTMIGKIRNAMFVGGVLMIFGIINLYMIPHPAWFIVVSLLMYIPFAFLGGKLALKLKGRLI